MITAHYRVPEDYPVIATLLEGATMLGLNGPVSHVFQNPKNYALEIQGAGDSDKVHLRLGESIVKEFDGENYFIRASVIVE